MNYNPHIIPFLKEILEELISNLKTQTTNYKQQTKTLQILKVLIMYGKGTVVPYVDIITEAILNLLENK